MAERVMLIGSKESFLIRVLLKKLTESGFEGFFVKTDVTAIEAAWENDASMVYYLDNAEHVQPEILHFLQDKLNETDKQIALIGEKTDADDIRRSLPDSLIWGTFIRPLDTNRFIEALQRHANVKAQASNRKTVLIVDDDATYLGVIREWLKGRYKVGMANSGAQALQWLGSNYCDLILLDFEMPVVSGPKVLEMLRSDPDTARIPVFFLTSKNDKESVMQVMALHPENYLLKTIERGELLQKLDSFFLR